MSATFVAKSFTHVAQQHAARANAHARSNARARTIANAGTGRFIVGGNWKCNGDLASVRSLIAELNAGDIVDNVDVVVAAPFLYIDEAKRTLKAPIEVSAQNCWVGASFLSLSRVRQRSGTSQTRD
jgi:hypothetical protein